MGANDGCFEGRLARETMQKLPILSRCHCQTHRRRNIPFSPSAIVSRNAESVLDNGFRATVKKSINEVLNLALISGKLNQFNARFDRIFFYSFSGLVSYFVFLVARHSNKVRPILLLLSI